jgi:hypothetical protein
VAHIKLYPYAMHLIREREDDKNNKNVCNKKFHKKSDIAVAI